ncbi:FAD-dependent monooxygenase [Mycobacteriaceae bacterium NPDC060252]
MSTAEQSGRPVIIAGAGPTGLTLATELRRGGVEVVLLERRAHRGVDGSRAAGMQPRTIEMLDQRGIVDRFLAVGPRSNLGNFAGIMLDYSGLSSRFPYAINILQAETETLLDDLAGELGVTRLWSTEVTVVDQDADGVRVTVEGPTGTETLWGSYLVGCDGGRSTVRRQTGVGFPGTDATMTCLIGDVMLDDPPQQPLFLDRRERGMITAIQFRPGWYRVVTTERERAVGPSDPVTLDELRESTLRVAGTDFGMHSATWLSHFGDAIRQADQYQVGRVFLAGDAAHIHLPAGGQGMNMGMQDAFNLGWKLAAVARGEAPESLLATYHDERHAIDAETLDVIRAQSVLTESSARTNELYTIMKRLIGFTDVNDYLAKRLSGLDIRYAIPGDHPLVGRRLPDLDLRTTIGATRAYELLNSARPVLLLLSDPPHVANTAAGWADRIDIVTAETAADTPTALLIRPDGYVAWTDGGPTGLSRLHDSLTTWCGPEAH